MQKKTKNEYDVTRNMLRTIRTITESVTNKTPITEEEQPNAADIDMGNTDGNVKDNITVINDVDVKILSSDERDMELKEDQKNSLSKLIDSFKSQVSQLVEFKPGITINQTQIRLDGVLSESQINFVFIAGDEAGVYVNADMLKLEQNVANDLTKLSKFELTFKTELDPIITQRKTN
jgi:hypothetical protein